MQSDDRAARDADEARWQRLLRLLSPVHRAAALTARRLCRSPADGDDLLQEAVLRAHRKLDSLRDEDRFRSWFYAVLLSVHRSRSRRDFWRRFLPLDVAGGAEPTGEDGRSWDETRVRTARVSRALSTLPPVQREAVVLHEIDGYSVEEIATMQAVSVSAVKSRLKRGRERLRRHYARLGVHEASAGAATAATALEGGLR